MFILYANHSFTHKSNRLLCDRIPSVREDHYPSSLSQSIDTDPIRPSILSSTGEIIKYGLLATVSAHLRQIVSVFVGQRSLLVKYERLCELYCPSHHLHRTTSLHKQRLLALAVLFCEIRFIFYKERCKYTPGSFCTSANVILCTEAGSLLLNHSRISSRPSINSPFHNILACSLYICDTTCQGE